MPSVETRLASIETIVLRLVKHLIGEDGNGGLIHDLKTADEANKAEIAKRHKENQDAIQKLKDQTKIIWGAALGVYIALSFVTGNGVAGLEHILKLVFK